MLSAAINFVGENAVSPKDNDIAVKDPESTVNHEDRPVSALRRAFPQVVAATVKNFLLLDLGMTLAFSTIVIPDLTEGKDARGVFMTKEDASWLGSVVYICQPVGSVLAGLVLEPFGRKYSMMVVNIPHIVGWFLFATATSKTAIFAASIIMGLGIGFMEAPIITYVGEIAEPKFRGTLVAYSGLFSTLGVALVFMLGAITDWRTAAAILAALPVLTILALTQIPETPLWLLSRGRDDDARKSLQWLRGWVSVKAIEAELSDLKRYSSQAFDLGHDNLACEDATPPTARATPTNDLSKDPEPATSGPLPGAKTILEHYASAVNNFLRPEMLRPLLFVSGFFFFASFTGVSSTRPFLVKVIRGFQFPIEPYKGTVVFGSIGFISSICCVSSVAKFRKRPIALVSLFLSALSTFALAALPIGALGGWPAFLAYGTLYFFTSYGAASIVWSLLSEIMPYRGRGQGTGVGAASSYIFSFASTKTYLYLEEMLGLQGVFVLYGVITLVGCAFLYFCMPETEGLSLEDIEKSFTKKKPKPAQELEQSTKMS